MHILHFLPVYAPAWQFGGPVLSVSRLCEGLVKQGINVRVITTNAGLPNLPAEALCVPQVVNGVEVFYYPVDSHDTSIRSRALVESLSEHMKWAQVLHLSSIWQPLGIPVQQSALEAGVPVLQTLRGALGPYSWRRGLWKKAPYFLLKERPLLQRAAALHCTTYQESLEIEWLGLKPTVYTLSNPIDFSRLCYNPSAGSDWRHKNQIPLDLPLLLVAGRFHHKKGLDLLPQVLTGIKRKRWGIVFIGQDEDRSLPKLKSQLESRQLLNHCYWFDSIPSDELVGPYNAADLLLLPSRHENFGNVVVEALACGCGTLISDKVAVGEELEGCPGVVRLPRSSGQWTAVLTDLLGKDRPGPNSSKWIMNYFSTDQVALKAITIYRAIS